jgi:hypothetical protein
MSTSLAMRRPSSLASVKSKTTKRASSAGRDFTISAKASLFLSSETGSALPSMRQS